MGTSAERREGAGLETGPLHGQAQSGALPDIRRQPHSLTSKPKATASDSSSKGTQLRPGVPGADTHLVDGIMGQESIAPDEREDPSGSRCAALPGDFFAMTKQDRIAHIRSLMNSGTSQTRLDVIRD